MELGTEKTEGDGIVFIRWARMNMMGRDRDRPGGSLWRWGLRGRQGIKEGRREGMGEGRDGKRGERKYRH